MRLSCLEKLSRMNIFADLKSSGDLSSAGVSIETGKTDHTKSYNSLNMLVKDYMNVWRTQRYIYSLYSSVVTHIIREFAGKNTSTPFNFNYISLELSFSSLFTAGQTGRCSCLRLKW